MFLVPPPPATALGVDPTGAGTPTIAAVDALDFGGVAVGSVTICKRIISYKGWHAFENTANIYKLVARP